MGQAGIYAGIDVAKAKVDVAVRPTGERWEVPRDAAGIPQLVAEMKTLGPSLVLLEATGGLELPLVAALAAEALPVVVVNPRQVRDFARATGKLAQTDARDTAVLAHFAEAIQPPVRPLRDAETQELNSRTARRQQVMTLLVSEKNRLGAATSAVRPRIAAHITWLEQDLNDLDQTTLTKACDRCSGRVRCGGSRTTSGAPFPAWVSNSPSRCWQPSRVGHPGPSSDRRTGGRGSLQPRPRLRGKRAVWRARARVRATLYMGALVASRHNPVIRDFYQKLLAAGKPKRVALVACMRKLLVILNSMLKHSCPWRDMSQAVVDCSS